MIRSKGGGARGDERRRVAGVAALFALAACIDSGAGSDSGGGPTATPSSGSATVGLAGGHVTTSDGAIDVFLPYGALSANVSIKVQKIAAPAAGSVGPVFEITPSGTTFSRPIVLTFHYRTADLGGADPETLSIATYEGGQWHLYPSRTDMGAGTVAADVPHFSPWAVVLPGSGTIVDAGVPPADAAVDATTSQDAQPDIGSGGNGGGAAGAGGTTGAAGTGGKGGTTGAAGTGGKGGTTGAAGTGGKAGAGGGGGATGGGGLDGGASGHDGGAAGTNGSGGTTGAGGTTGGGGSSGASGTAGTDGGVGNEDAHAQNDLACDERSRFVHLVRV